MDWKAFYSPDIPSSPYPQEYAGDKLYDDDGHWTGLSVRPVPGEDGMFQPHSGDATLGLYWAREEKAKRLCEDWYICMKNPPEPFVPPFARR